MSKIEDDLKYILHSLCHIAVIEEVFKNFNDYNEFTKDYYLLDVIVLRLQQVGENVAKLSNDFKESHSEIDFMNIKGLRNVAVHNYEGLFYDDIYSIVIEDIPDLKSKYENILLKEFNLSKNFIENYVNYYIENRIFKDIL